MSVTRSHLGKWRSIEFELLFKSKKHLDELKAFIKKKKYTRRITITNDNSIKPDKDIKKTPCGKCYECRYNSKYCENPIYAHTPKEIIVSYYGGKEQIVRDVCDFLKGKAYVNKTCGTHVHFDMRHVNQDMVRVYSAKLACCVDVLKTILPKYRRTNKYCNQPINNMPRGDYDYEWEDRYYFINLGSYKKYKTIEVRGHSGTLNADKILNWIKICETIMNSDKTYTPKNISELIKNYSFDKSLSTFIKQRHKEVNIPEYDAILET